MNNYIMTLLSCCLFLIFLSVGTAAAQDNSCVIMAPAQNDAWVIVYDADRDGNRNQVLWEGKIEAGKGVTIESTVGQIRYGYKLDPNQPYAGDITRDCWNQISILVE